MSEENRFWLKSLSFVLAVLTFHILLVLLLFKSEEVKAYQVEIIARERVLICYQCQSLRDLENILWAMYEIRTTHLSNPDILSPQVLLEYGRRFHNSSQLCPNCSVKRDPLERIESQ